MYNLHFFAKAREASKLSDAPKYHIGCITVYKKHILSVGFNSNKTHPIQKLYNKERFDSDSTPHSLHAEITALMFIKDRKDIKWGDVEIYTYRENRQGNPRLAKPCKSCMALIRDLGIHKIYFSITDGFAEMNVT